MVDAFKSDGAVHQIEETNANRMTANRFISRLPITEKSLNNGITPQVWLPGLAN
jgi:hypothetical protein